MKEITCRECPGACCEDIQFTLTPEEAEFLKEGGTRLIDITPAKVLRMRELDVDGIILGSYDYSKGKNLYLLIGFCGYSAEMTDGWKPCLEYDNERRPEECDSVKVGKKTCLNVRERLSINTIG